MNLLYSSSNRPDRTVQLRQKNKAKVWFLLVAFALCALCPAAKAVTLAWNPSTSAGIAGYRVYEGTNSHAYNLMVNAGASTQASLTVLSNGLTYYFAVTAYDSFGIESDYSAEVSYTPGGTTNPITLVFAADSGSISGPFAAPNGVVSQTVLTGATNGGRAVYNFSISKAGPYTVSAMVNAPNNGANSFYINVDAEPTDPQNIWDIPVTTGFMSRTVSWTIGGAPQIFNLGADSHQLIVRGREPNTQLSTITIAPAYGVLQIARNANRSILLTAFGQSGHTYDVQASTNLVDWTSLGLAAPDSSSALSFTDAAAASLPKRFYRLQDQGLSGVPPGGLQIVMTASKSILLTAPGQLGHTYDVQASTDLAKWTSIGIITTDPTGKLSFADPAAATLSMRFYRLHDHALGILAAGGNAGSGGGL